METKLNRKKTDTVSDIVSDIQQFSKRLVDKYT